MLKISRQEKILSLLNERGTISFNELMQMFQNVSKSTLRRDLILLSQEHPITLTYGGATIERKHDSDIDDPQYNKLAQLALSQIKDYEIIFLDCGRTIYNLACLLANSTLKNLTIVTSTTAHAEKLKDMTRLGWNIVILGGEYHGQYHSLTGPIAENSLKGIKIEKMFIGTTGVDNYGFYTNLLSEINLRNIAIANSNQVFLVTNSSKFESIKGHRVAGLEKISTIVSNRLSNSTITALDNFTGQFLFID